MTSGYQLICGDALKAAASAYLNAMQTKAQRQPDEAISVFNKWFMRVMTRLLSFDPARSWEDSLNDLAAQSPEQGQTLAWDFLRLRQFLDRWQQGRFVSYESRKLAGTCYQRKYGSEFGIDVLLTCQGAPAMMQWRGLPLMKTAFDFAIYPQLIQELKPRTIFEIGSGTGASAMWFADLLATADPACAIYSVDLKPVQADYRGVHFGQGDCNHPESLFDQGVLASVPHPWLVIEDAHHNVTDVLVHMHQYTQAGDYVVVEDSEIKEDAIRRFLSKAGQRYQVDTKYTDFFGRNATCAIDSIFVRI